MSEPSLAHRVASLALVPALLLAGAACSDDESGSTPPPTTRPADRSPSVRQPALEGQVSVVAGDAFAAALPELIELFRTDHPGVEVTARFGSTSVLAMELLDGAPADVFISADQSNMTAVADAGRVDGPPQVLALNRLVIVTLAGNPDDIEDLSDLGGAGTVALCDSAVPCGAVADDALEPLGLDLDTDRVASASDAIDAVRSGDAGAALVFESDVLAAGDGVELIEPTEPVTTAATVAALSPGDNELAARAFVDFVRGPDGLDVLVRHGFAAPI